jgi:hypothetical protein
MTKFFRRASCLGLGIATLGFMAVALERPVLQIRLLNGTNVVVSWPVTNAGFLLEAGTNLSLVNSWAIYSNIPFAGGSFQFTDRVNTARFYRLVNDTNAMDVPDPLYLDSNGDGIDGDRNHAIFVANPPFGNDNNPGTEILPVATLEHAIELAAAQNKDVYAAAGIYMPAGTLMLSPGVSLYGLFDGTTNWGRGGSNTTIILGAVTAVLATNIVRETHLEGFRISSASASAAGQSSYGVFIANGTSNVVVRYCSIIAGNGGDGQPGPFGVSGPGGGNGASGQGGSCDNGNGAGGPGGVSVCGRNGGAGGNGGPEGSNNGSPGGTGAGGTPGGVGGPGGNPGGPGTAGARGNDGSNGSNSGSYSAVVNLAASGYMPQNGLAGSAGTPGFGGGGGGGGGGQGCCLCDDGGGNGGGGGGAGGCAGDSGKGGLGGGGSFAVFVFNAKAIVTDNNLSTGKGGNGGSGGNGGLGGDGGSGGFGGTICTGEVGAGGNGGPGGRGGAGGSGSGGAGGPSIGLAYSAATVIEGSNSFTVGTAGTGGLGGMNNVLGSAPNGPSGVRTNILSP